MAKFIGRTADVGIAKEASRGTAEASADFWVPKVSLTLDDGIEQVIDESSVGVIEDATDAVVVGKYATGEIEGNIGSDSIGLILLSALGSVSTSGPADTSVYTHTFTVAQSAQHQSLTLFLDNGVQDYAFPLAMLDTFGLDISLGQFARFTAGFRSKAGETDTLTPSYTAESTFLPQHGTVKLAANVAGLGAASAIDVRSVQLNISKNLMDDYKLGSINQDDILNQQFAVEGTVELVFDAETFKDDMLADTAKAMRIALTNSDVTIGGSSNPSLTVDLSKIKVVSFETNYDNNGIVTATANFKALYNTTDNDMIEVALVNETTSY